MRIGIVGSGIAGLAAGWFLKQAGHHVTLFEKHSSLGMDAHSIDVTMGDRTGRTDVPPRMFNEPQWPKLCQLYRQIGVEVEPVSPSKSFCQIGKSATLKLGSSYQPKLSPSLLLNTATRAISKDINRMMAAAPDFLRNPSDQTMREYLTSNRYSDLFVFEFLYPALSSTVCTCSFESLNQYPASTLIQMMQNLTAPTGLFRTTHGTRDVVNRLASDLDEIRLETQVLGVKPTEFGVQVKVGGSDRPDFDHVIVATQANAVEDLVEEISNEEKDVLGEFQYENVKTVVHTDNGLMPVRRKDWSNFNVISDGEGRAAMCTIWLNEFYPSWNFNEDLFQTIMPLMEPSPDSLVATAQMQRPVVNQGTLAAQELLGELHRQPNRRIWFCGSYASPGVPLLESGVRSSFDVCQRILSREFNLT